MFGQRTSVGASDRTEVSVGTQEVQILHARSMDPPRRTRALSAATRLVLKPAEGRASSVAKTLQPRRLALCSARSTPAFGSGMGITPVASN
jgi:hypothetical protein